MTQIAVIGTGYVGLVAGTCFAHLGWSVTCMDQDTAKIEALRQGHIPIFEPGLTELVVDNVISGNLRFTDDMATAVRDADVVFMAVGTPSKDEDGDADLSQLFAALEEAVPHFTGFTVVVNKSTVPVGTGRLTETRIRELRADLDFAVASNPEFLREGSAVEDFLNPDRIVVGTADRRAQRLMRVIYRPLAETGAATLFTNINTAELIKYAANSFLAAKISFINEMADLSEIVGADIADVATGMGMDSRIGPRFLNPGPGYGGSCFPKDTRALRNIARANGKTLRLTEAAIDANDARKRDMTEKVLGMIGRNTVGATAAILGVAFKANTDDMRESPALDIIAGLQAAGVHVRAYDPEAMGQAARLTSGVEWMNDAYSAANKANLVVIVTEWDEFKVLDLTRLKQMMREPQLVDLRNLYDPAEMAAAGFDYVSIGRAWIPRWTEQMDVAE